MPHPVRRRLLFGGNPRLLVHDFNTSLTIPGEVFTGGAGRTSINLQTGLVTTGIGANVPRAYIDANGIQHRLLEPQRTNYAARCQEFDNATWIKAGTSTVTPDTTTAPDGTLTADTLNFPAGTDWIYQAISPAATQAGQVVTVSLWLAGSGTVGLIAYDNVTGGTNRSIVTLTGTLTRYAVTVTIGAGANDVRFGIGRAFGGTATSVIAWWSQWEIGGYASSPILTTSIAVTRSAESLYEPRTEAPQPSTVYGQLIIAAVSPASGTYPLFQRGDLANSGVRMNAFFDTLSNRVRFDYTDGVTGSTATDTQTFAAGDVLEFCAVLNANGTSSISTAKNGGAFTTPTTSVAAPTFPGAYAGSALLLSSLSGPAAAANPWRAIKYVKGAYSGSTMRTF